MAITKTDTGRIILANAEYVHVTPYENEDEIGGTTYDIVNIVADSLAFTPDDNTTNAKDSEFTDDALFENVILGKYQFAATCIDFQNTVMQAIYGWEVDEAGNVYAPEGYKDIYALIEVGFRNEDVVVVAPKVKLNSKATIGTLKTGTGEGAIAGTAYSAVINGKKKPLGILKAEKNDAGVPSATYTLTVGETATTFKCGDGKQSA